MCLTRREGGLLREATGDGPSFPVPGIRFNASLGVRGERMKREREEKGGE